MPGDDLVDDGAGPVQMHATRCIDVAAPPHEVFEWLAQMGTGRAGWYSYDLIDNLGRPSATSIHPEWAVQRSGDEIPGGPITFTAAVVERPHRFVMALLDHRAVGHRVDFTLAYRLDGTELGTRVVSRARARITGPLGSVTGAALRVGDAVMVRRQLLGLARRCGDV